MWQNFKKILNNFLKLNKKNAQNPLTLLKKLDWAKVVMKVKKTIQKYKKKPCYFLLIKMSKK